jgi:hypothetical protein
MANESFDVNWTDVDLMNQRTNMSYWAASTAMALGCPAIREEKNFFEM